MIHLLLVQGTHVSDTTPQATESFDTLYIDKVVGTNVTHGH